MKKVTSVRLDSDILDIVKDEYGSLSKFVKTSITRDNKIRESINRESRCKLLIEKYDKLVSEENVIIEQSRRSKVTLFIDENVSVLEDALRDLGYKVYSLPKGLKDSEIIKLIEGDTIVTRNSKDFIIDAVKFDIDIINLDSLKFIDNDKTSKNITARKVALAIRESGYTNMRGNFMLKISDDKKPKLTEIT